MKSVVTFLLAGFLALGATSSIDQAGGAGFFGPHDLATAGLSVAGKPKVNAMNAWVGAIGLSMAPSMAWLPERTHLSSGAVSELAPEIHVNNAIRFRAASRLATRSGHGVRSLYEQHIARRMEPNRDWSSRAQWWTEAQTPWGVLVAGKRDLGHGAPIRSESRYYRVSQFGRPVGTAADRRVLLSLAWSGLVNSLAGRDVVSNITVAGPQLQPTSFR